jgi:hypothetical protein
MAYFRVNFTVFFNLLYIQSLIRVLSSLHMGLPAPIHYKCEHRATVIQNIKMHCHKVQKLKKNESTLTTNHCESLRKVFWTIRKQCDLFLKAFPLSKCVTVHVLSSETLGILPQRPLTLFRTNENTVLTCLGRRSTQLMVSHCCTF